MVTGPSVPGMAVDGSKVQHIRADRGLTQAQLAAKAGISRATLVKIEGGQHQPYPLVVAALARALDVNTGALEPEVPS